MWKKISELSKEERDVIFHRFYLEWNEKIEDFKWLLDADRFMWDMGRKPMWRMKDAEEHTEKVE